MAIYFVDYENVHEGGLKGIEQLSESDTLCLLYSNTAQSLTIDTMSILTVSSVKITYFKCQKIGKNYLDFQLATICGMMAGSQSDTDFIIVSGDKGFISLVDFWNDQQYFGKNFTCRLQGTVEKEKNSDFQPKTPENRKNRQKPIRAAKQPEKKQVEDHLEKIQSEGKHQEGKRPEIIRQEEKRTEEKRQEEKRSEVMQPEIVQPEIIQQEAIQTENRTTDQKNSDQKNAGGIPVGIQGQGMLQKEGVDNIPDSVKKKVRQAVKILNLKPSEYIVIYRNFLKSVSESDLKNRLMRRMGKELGTKTYESILPIYQGMLQH